MNASEGSPEQQSGVSQWTGGVCVGDMTGSDVKISGDACGSEAGASTGGTSPSKGKVVWADAGVGGIHSSEDLMPDVYGFGESIGERRDATCSAVEKSRKGPGDGPQGLPAPDKVRKLQITLYRKAKSKPGYRFWSLYGEVQREDVLREAWRRVAANGGVAGVDGERIENIAASQETESAWLEKCFPNSQSARRCVWVTKSNKFFARTALSRTLTR
ncbi:MAG TPA: hypothetical protein VIT91_18105 [Chthoniobacterales bacterium]